MAKDKNMVSNTNKDEDTNIITDDLICPACGSDKVIYKSGEIEDGEYILPFVCDSCGKYGWEVYNLSHYEWENK